MNASPSDHTTRSDRSSDVQSFPGSRDYSIGFDGGCYGQSRTVVAVVYARCEDAHQGNAVAGPWICIGRTAPCKTASNAARVAGRVVVAHQTERAGLDAWERDLDAEVAEWRRYGGRA